MMKSMEFGDPRVKEDKGDVGLWAVRSTLLRKKGPDKFVFNRYEHAVRQLPHGIPINPKNLPDNPFSCTEDDCDVCFPQFFPASYTVNDDEAHEMITSLVTSIRTDLAFLRQSIQDHADFITTRWKKKSRDKRHQFLTANTDLFDKKWAPIHLLDRVGLSGPPSRKARPSIPKIRTIRTADGSYAIVMEMHTPESLRQDQLREKTLQSYTDSWFLPYLDAETLSEDPCHLLSLLHYRTINEPDKWIMFDNANIVIAEHFGIQSHIFNHKCVVMQGPKFGELVDWNAPQAHRWEIVGFTKAHVLLVAQQRLFKLLRKCVQGLFDEAKNPPVLNVHPKWTKMITTNFARFETDYAWSTEYVKPFSKPPSFDAREAIDLIASRHRATKDELDRLQTDPEYVQLRVREMSACLFFETFRKQDIMPFCIDYYFFETLHREAYWRQLAAESERMGERLDELERSWSADAQERFDQSVWIVQDLCVETFAVFKPQVESGLGFERGFERNFEFKGNAKHNRLNRTFSRRDWFLDDILYWSLSALGYDYDRPFTMDPSFNFSIVDYLCRTDKREANRLSQTMLDRVSDMSILSDIICAIRSDTTRNRVMPKRYSLSRREGEFMSEFIKKINAEHDKSFGDNLGPFLERACYQTPWPTGRKNEKWLERANASRESLEALWAKLRERWRQDLKAADVKNEWIEEDLQLLYATRGKAHLADLEAEKRYIYQSQLEQQLERQRITEPVQQTVWGSEHEDPVLTSSGKEWRIKSPQLQGKENKPPAPNVQEKDDILRAPPSIKVRSENLAVFTHMFPSCGEEYQRSFSWQHFLNAMIDAGFYILQSQGSAVTLKLSGDAADKIKTIVLHRPHPNPVVNPVMLRSIAKRMQKWFNWQRSTFSEKTK